MDYLERGRRSEALSYLQGRVLHGVKFGLETVRALLADLDHPERSFRALLVAGTNGKGSVVAYLDEALRTSGAVVGRYTSPHLSRVNERIAVGGGEISDEGFDACIETVRRCAARLVARGVIDDHPTFFEALTVAAFHFFRESRVEVAVLEVGMGARLDATNACDPLVSAIVTVALDHERFLGSTLGEIAREKAGVLRADRVTVLGEMAPEAESAIVAVSEVVGARLERATSGVSVTEHDGRLEIVSPRGTYRDVQPLPGLHQRGNVLVALRLLEAGREAGLDVDLGRAPEALSRARWPGRLEWIEGTPRVLLDGAHNPAAAEALAAYLAPRGPFVLVFGAMHDKDIEGMARHLFPLAHAIVLTRPETARAASPDEIVSRTGGLAQAAVCCPHVSAALDTAATLAASGEPVVVAGSLYLVGEARALLLPGGDVTRVPSLRTRFPAGA